MEISIKLSEFMSDINKSIFSDIAGNVDSFRQKSTYNIH